MTEKSQVSGLVEALAIPSGLTEDQRGTVEALEEDLKVQLAHKRRRLGHSLNVGRTAEALARVYGVDPYDARVAGILHDWEKAASGPDQVEKARELGLSMGVPLEDVVPLLHGKIAARTLPGRYPWLGQDILRAIDAHTTAADPMDPLSMVLFVADGIEPGRGAIPALEAQRALVGEVPLEDLFWRSFTDGIVYVIQTGRYLWPGTIDIYNGLLARRSQG